MYFHTCSDYVHRGHKILEEPIPVALKNNVFFQNLLSPTENVIIIASRERNFG